MPSDLRQMEDALDQISAVWEANDTTLVGSEANVTAFVRGVFEILGMIPSEQGRIRRSGQAALRADIVLFPDKASATTFARAAKSQQEQEADSSYQQALGVVEVEKLGASLDTASSDNTNPSYQIVAYLTHTKLPWGILTDGARWRLYHRFDPPRVDAYLEADLGRILGLTTPAERREAFRWFYAFFARSAFDRQPGRAFLDVVRAGSARYAVEVQEDLRTQAFAVVEALAQGLYATAPGTPFPTLYEQAIIILYRLLFIKYAEDRGILPVDNQTYAARYGFRRLEDELLAALDRGVALSRTGTPNSQFATVVSQHQAAEPFLLLRAFGSIGSNIRNVKHVLLNFEFSYFLLDIPGDNADRGLAFCLLAITVLHQYSHGLAQAFYRWLADPARSGASVLGAQLLDELLARIASQADEEVRHFFKIIVARNYSIGQWRGA